MPSSIPDAPTLLGAAIKYLEDELMPTLDGYYRFKTRVTINVLSTLRRELELRDRQSADEQSRLVRLLGHEGQGPELSVELAEKIRTGAVSIEDESTRDHIRQSLQEALTINNPNWLTKPDGS
jgi:hypothetical protein